jgi:ParB/RepB/Spo0J family partition protein
MNQINIEYINTQLLNPAIYNPRKWTIEQKNKLIESIQEFGIIDPIIVNKHPQRDNIVIGGHFRLTVCKELGYEKVPVVYVSLPLEKEKELNIRLNKNQGEFDYELLKEFDLNLLEDIGFTGEELSSMWDKLDTNLEDEVFDTEKELTKITNPKTKYGDVILLGNHKLICGDSNDKEIVSRLFENERTSMVYADPIYNINIDYAKGLGGKQNYGGDVNDNRTEDEYVSFLRKNITTALTFTTKDAHIFYWNTEQQIWILQTLYRELGIDNKRVCLWIKNGHNPTPQVAFNKCYEPCIYGTKGSPYLSKSKQDFTEILNNDIENGNNLVDQVNLWAEKRLSSKEYVHATTKPSVLHHRAILRCTKPNDIVFDPFGGSGSTLIACEETKRRGYLVELDPHYCDLIISRYEKMVGGTITVIPYEKTTN